MKPYVYPYKLGSVSAKALAVALNTKQLRAFGQYKYKPNHYIINWGNSTLPMWDCEEVTWANSPESIGVAQNKLATFNQFSEVGIAHPWYAVDSADLTFGKGQMYFARTKLKSHSGNGIVVITKPEEIVQAPMYTRYIKKKQEYRVHVVTGKVIDFQEKRKVTGWTESENYSTLIRNKHTGWVYCREEAVLDDRCAQLAIDAVSALKLDFGAVDIIYNEYLDTFYCLEVNTAPGIEGTTLTSYINSFKVL